MVMYVKNYRKKRENVKTIILAVDRNTLMNLQ